MTTDPKELMQIVERIDNISNEIRSDNRKSCEKIHDRINAVLEILNGIKSDYVDKGTCENHRKGFHLLHNELDQEFLTKDSFSFFYEREYNRAVEELRCERARVDGIESRLTLIINEKIKAQDKKMDKEFTEQNKQLEQYTQYFRWCLCLLLTNLVLLIVNISGIRISEIMSMFGG